MKVNVDLGVASKKDLLDHRSCFTVGQAVRRLEDCVVFASFLIGQADKGKVFSKSELELISAGIHTAANYAAVALHNDVPQKRDEVNKLASSAKSINKKIRSFLDKPKDGPEPAPISAEESKKIAASVAKLHSRVKEFSDDVEKLCYVERKKLSGHGPYSRASMGSSAVAPAAPPASPKASILKKHVYPAFSRPALHKSIKSIRRIP